VRAGAGEDDGGRGVYECGIADGLTKQSTRRGAMVQAAFEWRSGGCLLLLRAARAAVQREAAGTTVPEHSIVGHRVRGREGGGVRRRGQRVTD